MLGIGDKVVVPSPLVGDPWSTGNFSAEIRQFQGDGSAVVSDSKGNSWTISCGRLTKIEATSQRDAPEEELSSNRSNSVREPKITVGSRVINQGRLLRVVGIAGVEGSRAVAVIPEVDPEWLGEEEVKLDKV